MLKGNTKTIIITTIVDEKIRNSFVIVSENKYNLFLLIKITTKKGANKIICSHIKHNIGKKINYGPAMEVIRKSLRELGEPLQRGLYRNSQERAEQTYDVNVFNNDEVNSEGRPLFLSRMGAYLNPTLILHRR